MWKIGARKDIFDTHGPILARSHHRGAASHAASLALLPPVAKIDPRFALLRGVDICEQRAHHSDNSRSILRHRGAPGGCRSLERADRRRPWRRLVSDALLRPNPRRCGLVSGAVAWSRRSRTKEPFVAGGLQPAGDAPGYSTGPYESKAPRAGRTPAPSDRGSTVSASCSNTCRPAGPAGGRPAARPSVCHRWDDFQSEWRPADDG